jgi:hypothetical protein
MMSTIPSNRGQTPDNTFIIERPRASETSLTNERDMGPLSLTWLQRRIPDRLRRKAAATWPHQLAGEIAQRCFVTSDKKANGKRAEGR